MDTAQLRGEALDRAAGILDGAAGELSFVPVAVLGSRFGVPENDLSRLVAATVAVAEAYQPGGDAATEDRADDAVRELSDLLGTGEEGVTRMAVLVQACAATAGLIRAALGGSASVADQPVPALLADILEGGEGHEPPVRTTKRVRGATTAILDLAAANRDPDRPPGSGHLTFGSGRRPCPAAPYALALATGVVEAVRGQARGCTSTVPPRDATDPGDTTEATRRGSPNPARTTEGAHRDVLDAGRTAGGMRSGAPDPGGAVEADVVDAGRTAEGTYRGALELGRTAEAAHRDVPDAGRTAGGMRRDAPDAGGAVEADVVDAGRTTEGTCRGALELGRTAEGAHRDVLDAGRTAGGMRRDAPDAGPAGEDVLDKAQDRRMTGKAAEFAGMHAGDRPLFLPNAWDHASASALAAAGFRAIGTTSLGIAAAAGKPDGVGATRAETVFLARALVHLPALVSVDIEGGFSDDPEQVGLLAAELAAVGVVGVNIEDGRGDGTLTPVPLQCAKIAAIRVAAPALFVNARTDVYWLGLAAPGDVAGRGIEEAMARAEAYRDAGAHGIFVPGLADEGCVRALVGVGLPLNILYSPAGPSLARLGEWGVRRVSTGSLLFRAAVAMTVETARAVRRGDRIGADLPSYQEIQGLAGHR
jgi:2-methylisocitrate lyase-like PEP mutase family enzyme